MKNQIRTLSFILSMILLLSSLISCDEPDNNDVQTDEQMTVYSSTESIDSIEQTTAVQSTEYIQTTETVGTQSETLPPIVIMPIPEVDIRNTYTDEPYMSYDAVKHIYDYFSSSQEEILSYYDMSAILKKIPDDYYETYPKMYTVPTSATLYKNGEVIILEADDPRLVKLINFYNNMVYHQCHIWSRGFMSPKEYNTWSSQPFKLELTYNPSSELGDYNRYHDKVTIASKTYLDGSQNCYFIKVSSETPVELHGYPYKAVEEAPLAFSVNWLQVFGF